ncbi:MAG TPA: MaoC family dehydratase, partial [Burkholderiales bacterium]|nr:MaoC family dehydratase [Burkholderiales bacterium]
MTRTFKVGDEIPSLTKTMTQEAINLFEKSGGATGPSQFTDTETARHTLGTHSTVASGRMSLTFAIELLRRYFGADIYNRGGIVDLRFLRPVRPGDSITFTGKVTGITKEANGQRVSVEVSA